jgi:MFS family permease
VLGLVGAFALAAQRGTEPPVASPTLQRGVGDRLSGRVLLPIVLGCASLGALFGAMEVAVVAFAAEADVVAWSGLLLMSWAAGSLVSGVVTGTVHWRVSTARRFQVGALLLAASVVPLPFVSAPALMAALLCLSGLAIAPTLIAAVAVTQQAVPGSRLTEALGWTSTGMAGGVAAGAAGVGMVIDRWGAGGGFVGIIAVGVLLVVSGLFIRSTSPAAPAVPPREAAPTAAA